MPGPPSVCFGRQMEAVLDLYVQPKDPARPLVCFDETSKALHEHYTGHPPCPGPLRLPVRPHGHLQPLPAVRPLLGWREVKVRARRTAVDCAQVLKELVDVHFPKAKTIRLVCDNPAPQQLAQHGRVRAERSGPAMPEPPLPGTGSGGRPDGHLVPLPQQPPKPIQWQWTTADARIRPPARVPAGARAPDRGHRARLAPCFRRPEVRQRAGAYLDGLLSDTRRKNGW